MASHNTYTLFPSQIDPRVYFQDVRLSQLNTKQAYEEKLAQGSYSEASAILQNSSVDYYGAYLLNLLENRLFAVQNYLEAKEKPQLTKYQPTEPEHPTLNMTWIE